MAGKVRLFAGSNSDIAVTIDARTFGGTPIHADAILITVLGDSGAKVGDGEFKIAPPVEIPDVLLKDGQTKLKSWTEIQTEISAARNQLNDVLQAGALEATVAPKRDVLHNLEIARDKLRAALAMLSVNVSAGAGAFIGIDGLPLDAGAATTAAVAIDLTLLDPALNPKPPDEAAVLTASIAAIGNVTFPIAPSGTVTRAVAMRVEVTVTRGALVQALPSVKINSIPGFPALDFEWPQFNFPTLALPDLKIGKLTKLLRLDLPVSKIPNGAPPIKFDPALTFDFAIQNRILTLSTGTTIPYQGRLVTDPGNQPVANVHGLVVTLSNAGSRIAGSIEPTAPVVVVPVPAAFIEKPEILPFTIDASPSMLEISLSSAIDLASASATGLTFKATLKLPRVLIRAKSDPALLLAFRAAYEQNFNPNTGATSGKLTKLAIVEPYPITLVTLAAEGVVDLAQALVRLVSAIKVPTPTAPDPGVIELLKRIADMAAAAVRWLARQAGAAADALLSIAEAIGEVMAKLVHALRDAMAAASEALTPHLVIEVQLDARSYALRKIIISPAWKAPPSDNNHAFKATALGFDVQVPLKWTPVLLIDFDDPGGIALLALPPADSGVILGTDLWMQRDTAVDAVRDTDKNGARPQERLIQVNIALHRDTTGPRAIAIARLSKGRVSFLETVRDSSNGKPNIAIIDIANPPLKIAQITEPIVYEAINFSVLDIKPKIANDLDERLLPFLQSSKGSGGNFIDSLGQYIKVKKAPPPATPANKGEYELPLDVELRVGETKVNFTLSVNINLSTFSVHLSGGERIKIEGKKEDNNFNFLGLNGTILPKGLKDGEFPPNQYPFFQLDFSKGDVRLALANEARLDLAYGKVASSGRGIVFEVNELGLSRAGIDLDAKVGKAPVQLAGVNMPFRFESGGLSIKRSEIQAFSIKGAGQLPPELVGEANATISISMGRGSDGSLIVQSAEAKLDKSNDPLVCHAMRFTITVSALGFECHNFASDGAGYHFYFTLTGTAEFRPREGEFTDGLLKHLGNVTITLDKAPLARDASMLLKAIDFQVTVEPKKRFNIFNLFTFELRGIGFHPSSPAFDGKPALSISGQVNFVEAGDIVSPKFDFHKLWIAPAKAGDWRPQIQFDALTVGIRFGGAASIEGTAVAVDETLPTLYRPGALPKDVTARGFLASGKLTIKGWGAMAAAMGFLELQKADGDSPRVLPLW